jgi:hypothetical protein
MALARTSRRKGNRRERKEIPSMKFRRNYSGTNFKQIPFFKKYPEIADILVEVKQALPDFLGKYEVYSYNKTHFEKRYSERIVCSNILCRNGGASLIPIFREMLKERKTELIASLACPGFHKKSRESFACSNQFQLRIHIDYR